MAEKRLTKEIAEQFLVDDESVDLEEFTEIDDDAAERLSQHEDWLFLDGVKSLTDSAAESLACHGGHLSLRGLTTLSEAAAAKLGASPAIGPYSVSLQAMPSKVALTLYEAICDYRGSIEIELLSANDIVEYFSDEIDRSLALAIAERIRDESFLDWFAHNIVTNQLCPQLELKRGDIERLRVADPLADELHRVAWPEGEYQPPK